jgi:hypothetical protein
MKYRDFCKLMKNRKYPKGIDWSFEDVLWNLGLVFDRK